MAKKQKVIRELRDPKIPPIRERLWSLTGHDRDVLTYTSPALAVLERARLDPDGSAGECQGQRVEQAKLARAVRRGEVEIRDQRLT